LLQSIKLQLSIWACGKLENVNIYIHVFSCIFLPFPFIAFGPLFPFADLSLCLTTAYKFHENAEECMTIDFSREVPVGSEL